MNESTVLAQAAAILLPSQLAALNTLIAAHDASKNFGSIVATAAGGPLGQPQIPEK